MKIELMDAVEAMELYDKDRAIEIIKKIAYESYKNMNGEDKVEYLNNLLAKGYTMTSIAESFNIDESTMRKHLSILGYERKWQFVKVK